MQADIQQLIAIVAKLRDPQQGCPWDLAQSNQSLMRHTLEELHELLYALAQNDSENIKEEIGDVLFQLIFYARIAEEQGEFNFAEVVNNICEKMIRRHPHIFAGKVYADATEQKADWQRIKESEKGDSPHSDRLFSDNVKMLPSMAQSILIQQDMAKLGFDWQSAQSVLPKIIEEAGEVEEVLNNPEKALEEYGDLLFAVLNLGRKLKIDSDLALRQANQKFMRRAQGMVELTEGKEDFANKTLNEKEALWEEVKRHEASEKNQTTE